MMRLMSDFAFMSHFDDAAPPYETPAECAGDILRRCVTRARADLQTARVRCALII